MQAKELAGASVQAPLWVLVLVTLSGTMAMHIFVPALPVAGEALGAEPSGMQQTITLYVIGLALGQLIYGPVSDTWGRRPALLVGLSLYFSASVLALFAPSLQWLVAARLLQALGGAAGITLGRAIVRDIAPPDRVTRDLALLNLLTLVGPGLSPIVGAYLADHFGWRAIYVFLVCIGSAMLFCAWKLLPETNLNRRPLAITRIALDYGSLLANPRFAAFMLGGACSSTGRFIPIWRLRRTSCMSSWGCRFAMWAGLPPVPLWGQAWVPFSRASSQGAGLQSVFSTLAQAWALGWPRCFCASRRWAG